MKTPAQKAAAEGHKDNMSQELTPSERAELDRLRDFLHFRQMHPDYEYRETDGARKAWDGEPDLTKEGWEFNETPALGHWERFDYHEVRRWRRLKGSGQGVERCKQ